MRRTRSARNGFWRCWSKRTTGCAPRCASWPVWSETRTRACRLLRLADAFCAGSLLRCFGVRCGVDQRLSELARLQRSEDQVELRSVEPDHPILGDVDVDLFD